MKKILIAGLLAATAIPASAATLTYTIADLATFQGYTEGNTGQSFTGTGFVGMYDTNSFTHLWGAESNSSTANAQVDFAALAGKTINSATLSWVFVDGGGSSYTVSITGFDSDGGLEYAPSGPNAAYGSTTITAANGTNSVDVTSMAAAAAAGGEDWLGFNMAGLGGCCLYTYTYAGFGRNADSAQVRLTVDYDDVQVPEPAMLGLFGLGAIGLGLVRRKRA